MFKLILMIVLSSQVYAIPLQGYISNIDGKECWYDQKVKKEKYLHSLVADTSTLTFKDPKCMKNDDAGVDLMMINNVISLWYSHSDARFSTRKSEIRKHNGLQIKGFCIQSGKYPLVSVAVDYIGKIHITSVKHSIGIGGCE